MKVIKKIVALILLMCYLFIVEVPVVKAVDATAEISLNKSDYHVGDQVTATIAIKQSGKIGGVQFDFSFDKNGNTVTDETKLVGTGMKVVATKDGDKKENTIIVTGDNTGDGKLNTADILKLKRAVAKMIELNEIEKRASDVRNDGQINQKDILKMSRLVAGIPDK